MTLKERIERLYDIKDKCCWGKTFGYMSISGGRLGDVLDEMLEVLRELVEKGEE